MIEIATEEEIEFILSHAGQSASEGAQMTITQEQALELLAPIVNRGASYLVSKEEGAITGWILLAQNMDYFSAKEYGFIYEIFILPEHRGKGLSTKLINEGKAFLKDKGFDEVRLNVFSTNFAKKIYEKMGFTEVNCIMKSSL